MNDIKLKPLFICMFASLASYSSITTAGQNTGNVGIGEYVQDVILDAGDKQYVHAGTVTTVYIFTDGYQSVYGDDDYGQRGKVIDVSILGGVQDVQFSDVYNSEVSYGGIQNLNAGASAEVAHISFSGVQNVNSGSLSDQVVVAYGGTQNVNDNGVATNINILSGGAQYVNTGGVTTDTTLEGGFSWLRSGSLADGVTSISHSGQLFMDTGSRATDVHLNNTTLFVTGLTPETKDLTSAQIDKLTMNSGNVAFMRDSEGDFTALNISELSGTGNFLFNSSLAERKSNFVTIEQGTGKFGVSVSDSGKEITDHTDLTVNLIHDQGGNVDFSMVTASGRSTRAVDGGTYMYTLQSAQDKDGLNGGNVWFLGAIPEEVPGNGNGNGNGEKPMTTPATDAILSMSTAGLNVMRGELDSLRAYRSNQTTKRKHGEGNVWGHYLGKKSAVDTSNGAAYKLHQNGFELGGDITTGFDKGNLVTGGFVTLSDNKVNHARGGKSKVDSYGLGAYATWYDNSGFYVDGALKANRLESTLNAKMTNGNSTSGNWHQYGISTAVEGGFTFKPSDALFVEPFIRTTATHINGANVSLTNGMQAQTGKARSLTAEAGTRIGTQFSAGKTQFAPYMHLSVEQEFAKSNQTTINGVNRFDNNLNGTSGKYGVGMSAQLVNDIILYGEMNYRQGSYIEEPMQGTAGIRIGF